MAIPDYQSLMLPLLKYSSDKKEHSLREAIEFLAAEFVKANLEFPKMANVKFPSSNVRILG